MQRHHSSINGAVAMTTVVCLVLLPFVDAIGAQAPAGAKPANVAGSKAAPAAQATARPVDGGWPKAFTTATARRRVTSDLWG